MGEVEAGVLSWMESGKKWQSFDWITAQGHRPLAIACNHSPLRLDVPALKPRSRYETWGDSHRAKTDPGA